MEIYVHKRVFNMQININYMQNLVEKILVSLKFLLTQKYSLFN